MSTSTPSSSIASDLDGISETDIPSPLINTHHQHQSKPKPTPRNLVICLDGTHNSFCDHNSNVVRLFELLEKSDRQLCYYDSGVGTQQGPWLYGLKKDFAMVTDLAFAWLVLRYAAVQAIPTYANLGLLISFRNFKTHVIDAYRFVMDQYQ